MPPQGPARRKTRKAARRPAAAKRAAPKKAKRAAPKAKRAAPRKATKRAAPAKRKSPGRPGTAGKAEGRDAVAAWIAATQPEHRGIVERVERIVAEEVPDVHYAIKWSMPMFGRKETGWFAAVASFKQHVGVNFFNGAALDPPPKAGDGKTMRSVRIEKPADLDEGQLRAWVRQAAANKGWGTVK